MRHEAHERPEARASRPILAAFGSFSSYVPKLYSGSTRAHASFATYLLWQQLGAEAHKATYLPTHLATYLATYLHKATYLATYLPTY